MTNAGDYNRLLEFWKEMSPQANKYDSNHTGTVTTPTWPTWPTIPNTLPPTTPINPQIGTMPQNTDIGEQVKEAMAPIIEEFRKMMLYMMKVMHDMEQEIESIKRKEEG